jgi:muconate cycloisomerase
VEQPLPRGREEELPLLAEDTSIPIMVDESLTTLEEAEGLIGLGGCGLFNVRLSKVGGMTAARRIALRGIEAGLEIQVGCQVGETAILSAAGRILAASLPAVRVVEGSYGTMLLSTDLTEEPFEFGTGGAGPLQRGPGLGVEVSRKKLDGLTVRSACLE